MYRLRITYVYGSAANATTAQTNLNNVLAGWSNPVVPERVTRNSATLNLMISGLTEAQGMALRTALAVPAHSLARSGGKFSLVRTPDVD